jgi:endonuclease/exonuclease/phosphatase family metal-dependent hydrolase
MVRDFSSAFGNSGDSAAGRSTIRMATWNILNLGASTAVDKRAKVISSFDIIGLQEIESPVGFKKLVKAVEENTGEDWGSLLSVESGHGGAAEYYGFMWRKSKVSSLPQPRGTYPEVEGSDFSREPFFASFVAGKFYFTLLNVHITWGSSSALRAAEVSRLSEVVQYVESLETGASDIIVMGDFNVNGPQSPAFSSLVSSGFSPVIGSPLICTKGGEDGFKDRENRITKEFSTYSTSTRTVGSCLYDNIWASEATLLRASGNEVIFTPHKYFFTDKKYPHIHVRKKISDHCPVWADFSVM